MFLFFLNEDLILYFSLKGKRTNFSKNPRIQMMICALLELFRIRNHMKVEELEKNMNDLGT